MNANTKRKTLHDFFTSDRPAKQQKGGPRQSSCPKGEIPGLHILKEFINTDEETALLNFLDAQQWRADLSRHVIHYGGTYCLMPPRTATPEERKKIESTILKAQPIPNTLDFLIDRMVDQQLYFEATTPEYCIVNEYKDNQGISPHVENFRFKSPVCGLTLSQGDHMRFRQLERPDDGSVRSGKAGQAPRTGVIKDIWMPRRSLLVMTAEAREKWQHEIPRSRRGRHGPDWRRVSLTFRTDKIARS